MRKWGFLTNHALVLLHVFEHPNSTLREIADAVGITERATLSIVRALEEERIISHQKVGRRNHYSVDVQALMDHHTAAAYTVKEIVTRMAQLVRSLPESDGAGPPVV